MPVPRVTFWGAARTVTGSMHLLEVGDFRVLLDCGMYQGRRAEARERNSVFPFEPASINAVILSHAHIDHCGNLPNLVKQKFAGPILCTPATKSLVAIMLADSAKIQEEDAAYFNRHRKHGEPEIQPLYTRRQAHIAAQQCYPIPYEVEQVVGDAIRLRFVEAGHLLGSAMVHIRIQSEGGERTITFTGDIGRPGLPILRDPAPVPPADLLISESTYGGRYHGPVSETPEALVEVVKRTVTRGGKVLIPAFSLGRTQVVIWALHQVFKRGLIPRLPVFVDSPLAANATEVFRLHPECFDEETLRILEDEPDLFGQRFVQYTRDAEQSKAISRVPGSCIIVAASGMCEAGRILHHLKNYVGDPKHTVLMIGYQAPETLGRKLLERRPVVRIFGQEYQPRAEVVALSGFSSHADHGDFERFYTPLAAATRHVRLVHGEWPQATALAKRLQEIGFGDVAIPDRGESVDLA